MEQHFLKSSFREKLIEHLFIVELLKISWKSGLCNLEIAKPEVDSQGYDLIAELNGIVRHIQLKAAKRSSRTRSQKIHVALANKPSGCVVWVYFDEESLGLGPFLFFGSEAGQPLPNVADFKTAKHAKGNAKGIKKERPDIRVVNKGQFQIYKKIEQLFDVLFSPNLYC